MMAFFISSGGAAVLLSGFIFGLPVGFLLLFLYIVTLIILRKKIKKTREAPPEIPYRNFADWSFFGKKIKVTAISSLNENDMLTVLFENKEHQARLFWNVFGEKARQIQCGDTLVIFLKTTLVLWKNGEWKESETWFDVVRPEFADSIPIQAL
jgi:hypothetical protein